MEPNQTQLVSWAPPVSPGAPLTQPVWLGELGHVTNLTYSFACPGGPDALTALLQIPASVRTPALNPGRIIQAARGASVVWEGRLSEPVPASDGWTVSAVGSGALGANFAAIYTTWSNPDDAINQAIARGLRWRNVPGITGSPVASQVWLGAQVDSGSQTITDHLNMLCAQGALTWQIGRFSTLSLFPLPTAVNRLLVATTPVPRTVAADVNTLWLRYQTSADTATVATYATAKATVPASVAAHGPMEAYTDLSSAGTLTSTKATANGNNVLARYQRANYSGTFAVRYGQLLTTGGTPVDLGAEQAGTVCRLILVDPSFGGEVVAGPVTFTVGNYAYDDHAQVASVTPMQSVASDLSSLLTAMFPSPSTLAAGSAG